MMGGGPSNLEINPKHPVVDKIKGLVGDRTAAPPLAEAYAELLYDVASVSSGYELNGPAAFAKRVVALMASGDDGLAELLAEMKSDAPAEEGAAKAEEKAADEGESDEDTPIEPRLRAPMRRNCVHGSRNGGRDLIGCRRGENGGHQRRENPILLLP